MRAVSAARGLPRPAASSSEMGRLEAEWLATEANLSALTDFPGVWIDRVHQGWPPDCALRPGNVYSPEGWRNVFASVITRYRGRDLMLYLRGDVAFAKPELHDQADHD